MKVAREITQPTIDHVVSTIAERFHPRRIILFGSRARGDHRPDSDIDLFIEMELDPDVKGRERVRRIHRAFDRYPCAMDIIVYTPKEVAVHKQAATSLVSTVLSSTLAIWRGGAR